MLSCDIIAGLLENKVSAEFVQDIIAVDSIMSSTKTKAKDFLENSTSFEDRVIKKCMRLNRFQNSVYVEHTIKLIKSLYEIKDRDSLNNCISSILVDYGYFG